MNTGKFLQILHIARQRFPAKLAGKTNNLNSIQNFNTKLALRHPLTITFKNTMVEVTMVKYCKTVKFAKVAECIVVVRIYLNT